MPSVCQSRLAEVHTKQSTRNGKTLSKMMASGLVASCSDLVLGQMTSIYQLQTTPLLRIKNAFCSNLAVSFAACTARPA